MCPLLKKQFNKNYFFVSTFLDWYNQERSTFLDWYNDFFNKLDLCSIVLEKNLDLCNNEKRKILDL
jgi:hypothetical protein